MPSLSTLAIYLPVAFVMAFTPGPATLFVLGRASTHGRRGGLVSAAGLLSGTLVLIGLAAAGLTGETGSGNLTAGPHQEEPRPPRS